MTLLTMRSITTVDPATDRELETYPAQSWEEIDAAIAACHQAQLSWSRVDVDSRAAMLSKVAHLLREEAEDHAALICREMGKPITEARAEVLKCATAVDFYAENAPVFLASKPVITEGARSHVAYEPIGLVFAVMPWNYPYWQVIRFAAPALAAGNGALLKHASNVTGAALAISSLFERAGFPKHLFATLLLGEHSMVDQVIADHRIAAVTLTGSEKAGASVAVAAGRALKKTVLELGGSDPFVVLDDADVAEVVPLALKARFGNTGQSCLCAKRFILEDGIHDEFARLATQAVKDLVIGSPDDDATQIGPLAKAGFVKEIDDQVQASIAMGARLLAGGHRLEGPGNYYAPTVLADVTPQMPVFRQETFGPVMSLVRATDDAHAIELANDTQYGLAASVWSKDEDRALEMGSRIASGALFINKVPASDPRLPFGGIKLSGYGRELSIEGIHEFTNTRTISVGA